MLRVRNEHSRAFRGRYSPEHSAWGVEIVESQYWQHVRSVDVIASNQLGKTFHVCELPTLYDILETRETVFYMNGSEDNAKDLWRTRWAPTIKADTVLNQQLNTRMEGGEWFARYFADGGLLYSTGPNSAAALSQRESRIVRCSELEKTPGELGNEASAYSLARARAGAYPATCMITSDCTITVRDGLSWKRFIHGDRSRFYIPCPGCGHYACPAHERHLAEPELGLNESNTHLFTIPEIAASSPAAAADAVQLLCRTCGHAFTDRSFRQAVRAGVWVPAGCTIQRHDDPKATPIPKVSWLDSLNRWASLALSDYRVESGQIDPPSPPHWQGPRLPDAISLDWVESPSPLAGEGLGVRGNDEPLLPAFRPDPRKSQNRSFWLWRLFAPKNTLGQVAREIVEGELGTATGDIIDDQKMLAQTCLVVPYVEPKLGASEDLNEDAVLACVTDHIRGHAPADVVAISRGIDIGDNEIHWVIRAVTADNDSYLVDHGCEKTQLGEQLETRNAKHETRESTLADPVYIASRRDMVFAALDRVIALYADGVPDINAELHPIGMTYIDSSYMSEDIYRYCDAKDRNRFRPVRGHGGGMSLGKRSKKNFVGQWTDSSEKKTLQCRDAKGRTMKRQYFDPADPRRIIHLDADYWKREVHFGIQATARNVLQLHRPGQALVKAWFYLHSQLRDKPVAPGSTLIQRRDRYITQVIAERWEEFQDPKSGILQRGWREYQHANHLLDAEAYALAALAALGTLPRYAAKPAASVIPRPEPTVQEGPAFQELPRVPIRPVFNQPRPVRRSYG
jgi:hypothetical protein